LLDSISGFLILISLLSGGNKVQIRDSGLYMASVQASQPQWVRYTFSVFLTCLLIFVLVPVSQVPESKAQTYFYMGDPSITTPKALLAAAEAPGPSTSSSSGELVNQLLFLFSPRGISLSLPS
jgi:hypothetical protein